MNTDNISSYTSDKFKLWAKRKSCFKTIADSFEVHFNSNNFEAIFDNFSPEMQTALPVNKTKDFFNGLKQQAGKITKREFVKYEDYYASYKTVFERAIFSVNISVDNNSKINGLYNAFHRKQYSQT